MFDHLEGRLVGNQATRLVLRVGGPDGAIGYQMRTPLGTAERLCEEQGLKRVYTLTVVQDERPQLLGFASPEERELCQLLLQVSGIGPRLALSLLSADTPRRLLEAIAQEDLVFLKSIKGLGPKTAGRLVLECKDKVQAWLDKVGLDPAVQQSSPAAEDAAAALMALGFSSSEAETKVGKALAQSPEATIEELVKLALRA